MPRQRCRGCGKLFLGPEELELHQGMQGCCESSASASSKTDSTTFTLRHGRAVDVTGTVCEYYPERAFGYVRTTDLDGHIQEETRPSIDVFFHMMDVTEHRVSEGDQLSFDVVDGAQGLRCVDAEITMRAREEGGLGAIQIQQNGSNQRTAVDITVDGSDHEHLVNDRIESVSDT